MHAKSLQLCPALCNPVDRSLLGSSVHGILQARKLKWVACPHPLPNPGIEPAALMSLAAAVGSLPLVPPGKLMEAEEGL